MRSAFHTIAHAAADPGVQVQTDWNPKLAKRFHIKYLGEPTVILFRNQRVGGVDDGCVGGGGGGGIWGKYKQRGGGPAAQACWAGRPGVRMHCGAARCAHALWCSVLQGGPQSGAVWPGWWANRATRVPPAATAPWLPLYLHNSLVIHTPPLCCAQM